MRMALQNARRGLRGCACLANGERVSYLRAARTRPRGPLALKRPYGWSGFSRRLSHRRLRRPSDHLGLPLESGTDEQRLWTYAGQPIGDAAKEEAGSGAPAPGTDHHQLDVVALSAPGELLRRRATHHFDLRGLRYERLAFDFGIPEGGQLGGDHPRQERSSVLLVLAIPLPHGGREVVEPHPFQPRCDPGEVQFQSQPPRDPRREPDRLPRFGRTIHSDQDSAHRLPFVDASAVTAPFGLAGSAPGR